MHVQRGEFAGNFVRYPPSAFTLFFNSRCNGRPVIGIRNIFGALLGNVWLTVDPLQYFLRHVD